MNRPRKKYLTQEASRVVDRLRDGAELRFGIVRRRTSRNALRFAFADGDVVAMITVEGLLNRGIVDLAHDGAVTIRSDATAHWGAGEVHAEASREELS